MPRGRPRKPIRGPTTPISRSFANSATPGDSTPATNFPRDLSEDTPEVDLFEVIQNQGSQMLSPLQSPPIATNPPIFDYFAQHSFSSQNTVVDTPYSVLKTAAAQNFQIRNNGNETSFNIILDLFKNFGYCGG